MTNEALGTMTREDKGPLEPAPQLSGALGVVADAVAAWPGIISSTHWDLNSSTRVDGVDFYYHDLELGHLHLGGDMHIATDPALARTLVGERLCRPFPYQHGWVRELVQAVGTEASIALFRRNYDRLVAIREAAAKADR